MATLERAMVNGKIDHVAPIDFPRARVPEQKVKSKLG